MRHMFVRDLGHIPKRKTEHDDLAQKWQRAVKSNKFNPLQKEEAEALTAAQHASGTASQRVEKASGLASQRVEKNAGPRASMRERPSTNSEMNLRRPASATGAVVQRAETRAGLGNTSTERADKNRNSEGKDI